MTACAECGSDCGMGHFEPDDADGPLCRRCYNQSNGRRRPRVTGYVSPDDYEKNAEAVDHLEAEHRRRVVENVVNQA